MKAIVLAALVTGLFACSASALRLPPTGPHENEEPVLVPYPPPPAKVEVIPPEPAGPKTVWVDGSWEWRARRWVWIPGRWETFETGSLYAPPLTIRLSDGTLGYFAGRWITKKTAAPPAP